MESIFIRFFSKNHLKLLEEMMKYPNIPESITEYADILKMPKSTVRDAMKKLYSLNVVKKTDGEWGIAYSINMGSGLGRKLYNLRNELINSL